MLRLLRRIAPSFAPAEPEWLSRRIEGSGHSVIARLPCPYCSETEAHRGTCPLSVMRCGEMVRVVAIAPSGVPA